MCSEIAAVAGKPGKIMKWCVDEGKEVTVPVFGGCELSKDSAETFRLATIAELYQKLQATAKQSEFT